MATLVLRKLFVNLVATGEAVSAQSAPGREPTNSADGETRTYAGGRRRSIAREGVKGTYSFTLRLIPRADVDTLTSWMGHLVQVRDDRGRRFYGTFFDVVEVERRGTALFDVPIVLQVVTHDEGA